MSSTLRGKHLHAQAREMAFNLYQSIESQNEDQCTKEIKDFELLRLTLGLFGETISSLNLELNHGSVLIEDGSNVVREPWYPTISCSSTSTVDWVPPPQFTDSEEEESDREYEERCERDWLTKQLELSFL
ncbi:hypothetical protein FQA39_LY08588 [Lamprigera yunnana]|nr:hypothetical protein FQA39_LY08588 [Lamprigera yunnana]